MTDRELIVAAAQHVMGWRNADKHPEGSSPYFRITGLGLGVWRENFMGEEWNPLEYMADAWELVEGLNRQGWEATVVRHKRGCTATFEWRGEVEHSSESDTAPRAITLAALEAKGVQIDQAA